MKHSKSKSSKSKITKIKPTLEFVFNHKPVEFTFLGEPLTKSNNGHWFHGRICFPARIVHYEKALKIYAQNWMKKNKLHFTSKLVRVTFIYYYGTKRKKDLPNLPKTTCDALEDAIYENDFQIHELHLYRHRDKENPRLEVIIEEMEDLLWEN